MSTDKYKPVVFPILFLIMGLSSCVYDNDLAYLNDQVIALNRRVAKIEEAMDNKLSTIRSNQGDVRVELDQMRGEMAKLSGRLEDNEQVLRRTVEKDLGQQDGLKKGVGDLSQRVANLEYMVRAQHEYLGLEPATPKGDEGERLGPVQPAQPAVPPQVSSVTPATPPKPKDDELYDNSLALFRNGKYEDAVLGFKDFLRQYPKSDRADNAQFWVGECYMALKQYEQAILAYQEVIKRYPKGNKVPGALLKQSMAFLEIKDKTSSKLLLRKIIKDYPKSPEAKIAAKKLETIK